MKINKYVVVGQIITSRLEALDWYLEQKKQSYTSVGFPSPFSQKKTGYIKCYSEGRCTLNTEKSFLILQSSLFIRTLVMPLTFLSYGYRIFSTLLTGDYKNSTYIGIATFSSACGIIAKKIGLVEHCVYYCLDYYPPQKNSNFLNRCYHRFYKILDTYCVKNASVVWDISTEISHGRYHYSKYDDSKIRKLIVPLGYTDDVDRNVSINERWPYTIGFVGTVSDNQGLELVLKGISLLKGYYPNIMFHVIGSGPYYEVIKSQVKKLDIGNNVKLYGFIQSEKDVYDILSKCMVGVATWNGSESDNSRYADPGKPKLYALLGLPIIITKFPAISKDISRYGAGIVIDYQLEQFVNSLKSIFEDAKIYEKIVSNLHLFQKMCKARTIFEEAFIDTEKLLGN